MEESRLTQDPAGYDDDGGVENIFFSVRYVYIYIQKWVMLGRVGRNVGPVDCG